jgi:hypothetical protein
MSGKKWFTVGQAAIAEELEIEAQKAAQSKQNISFKIKPGEKGKFTLLDTPELYYLAHSVPGPNGGYVEYTCIKEGNICPLCTVYGKPTPTMIATVIDHGEWTDKMGNKHKYDKKLIKFRGDGLNSIRDLIAKNGDNLKFFTLESVRGKNKQSPASGSFFTVAKKLNKKTLMKVVPQGEGEDWLEPFDYLTLLAPKSIEELRQIAGSPTPVGGSKDEDPLLGDDDDQADLGNLESDDDEADSELEEEI